MIIKHVKLTSGCPRLVKVTGYIKDHVELTGVDLRRMKVTDIYDLPLSKLEVLSFQKIKRFFRYVFYQSKLIDFEVD